MVVTRRRLFTTNDSMKRKMFEHKLPVLDCKLELTDLQKLALNQGGKQNRLH